MSKYGILQTRGMNPDCRLLGTGLGALADRRRHHPEATVRIVLIFLVLTAADSTCSHGQTMGPEPVTAKRRQISDYRARTIQAQDGRIAAIKARLKSPKERHQSSADFRRRRAGLRKSLADFRGQEASELLLGSHIPLAVGSLGRLETCRVIQINRNGEMLVIQGSKLAEDEASREVVFTGGVESLQGTHRRIQNAAARPSRRNQNVYLVPLRLYGQGLWVRGLNNLNLSEGERLTTSSLMQVVERKPCPAGIVGTKTVFVLEPFDETPYLPMYGGVARQAPYGGSRKLKIYHESACSLGKKITDADRIGFDTEIDAKYYGYRPGRCLR